MAYLDAQGTVIALSTDGGTSYDDIPQVMSFDPPELTKGEKNRTDLSATLVKRAAGLKDAGTLSMEVAFDPDNTVHSALEGLYASDAECKIRLTMTDTSPTAIVYTGYISASNAPTSFEVDGDVMATFEMVLTELPS